MTVIEKVHSEVLKVVRKFGLRANRYLDVDCGNGRFTLEINLPQILNLRHMTSTHKFSVIILTTGADERLPYLNRLLQSLAVQSIKPWELIIASELSSGLEELLKKYFCPCRNHRVLITGYWNKCKTANRAIKESRGDVVFLLEDDLILKENFIEEMLKVFDLDPKIGCVHSRCIWVYREGLRSKGGVKGFIAKLISKLSIHESVLRRQIKKINSYLYEVPVFTMSVACRKEALYKAGLYDESVGEPISGEDYDLALRVRRAGYKVVLNSRAISYHFTRQVTKKATRIKEEPNYLEGINESEVYFMVKNRSMLGSNNIMLHAIYRALESIAWGIRARRASAIVYGIHGVVKGLIKGISWSKS